MNIEKFLRITRMPFVSVTIIAVLVGVVAAWSTSGQLNLVNAFLTFLGVILLHLGVNMINDYYDWKSGNDNVFKKPSPFSGGSRVIQEKIVKPKEMKTYALASFALGCLIGIYLVLQIDLVILWLGISGFILGYFYSADPIRFSHRGLGEFAIAISWALVVIGSFYVQTQTIPVGIVAAGSSIGLLVALVVWINEFSDMKADKEVGKDTLVVRLGLTKSVIGYKIIVALAYLIILAGAVLGYLPITVGLVLLSLPITWNASKTLSKGYKKMPQLIQAQATTIQLQSVFGILLIAGYLLNMFI